MRFIDGISHFLSLINTFIGNVGLGVAVCSDVGNVEQLKEGVVLVLGLAHDVLHHDVHLEGHHHHQRLHPAQPLAGAELIAVLGEGPGTVEMNHSHNVDIAGDGSVVCLEKGLGVKLGALKCKL